MVRFVHTADWQLGMRRHFLDEDAQGRFGQARLDALETVGALAAQADAAFVVVAGDVFEHNQVDRRTVLRTLDVLRGFPDVPVLLLPGNHDPLDSGSVFRSREFTGRCPPQVRVLDGSEPVPVVEGVEVVGAPWTSKRPTEDLAAAALDRVDATPGVLRVLVAHGAVDALVPDAAQPGMLRLALLESALADGRVAFVALGDRHSATCVGDSGRVWYAGTPEPTDYDETNPGKALVVDVGADRVDVAEHRVGRWTFRRRAFELAGPDDVAGVAHWLDEPADKPRTVAKVGLQGTLSLRDREALEARLAEAEDTYAALERWPRRTELVTAPDHADLEALAVGGFVRDAVDELQAAARAGGADATAAGDALGLLYRMAVQP